MAVPIAYGKTAVMANYGTLAVGVRVRRKARADWLALRPNAHESYVGWEKAEAIRKMVSDNIPTSRHHGAPKHVDALLAGPTEHFDDGERPDLRDIEQLVAREVHCPDVVCTLCRRTASQLGLDPLLP